MTKAEKLADAFKNLLDAAIKAAGDDERKVCIIGDGLNDMLDKLEAAGCVLSVDLEADGNNNQSSDQ